MVTHAPLRENNSVLRITSSFVVHDWAQPYNTHNDEEATGTGFIVKEICNLESDDNSFLLVTAYHVVENAIQILVRIQSIRGSSVISSKLIACNPDLDVAVLRVPTKLPEDVIPFRCGDSDTISPLDRVQALGYALGKFQLNYTTGVISGRTPSAIQIDAAINGGNSGGPVLSSETGLVIGIVISGYNNAQNMNFACPMKEAVDSMSRVVKHGKSYELVPDMGAKFVTTPSVLTESFGLTNGCMCTHIREDSNIYQSGVRCGHILTKINDHLVQSDETIRSNFWIVPLSYESIIQRGAIGDAIEIEYFDTERRTLIQTTTTLEKNVNVFREMWPEFEKIQFCTLGGVVVQPLVANLANANVSKALHWKFNNMMKSPKIQVRSVVIITHIQSNCPFKKTPGTLTVGDVIIKVNHISIYEDNGVDPFDQYINAWESLKNETIITLQTRDGGISSVTRQDLQKMTVL